MNISPAICVLVAGALVLSGCGENKGESWQGYVEGEYVVVAAPGGGWLTGLAVQRGQYVKIGDPLFELDDTHERAMRAAAEAQLAETSARLENLTKGKRAEEVAVIDEQIRAAEANLRFAATERNRQQQLAKTDAGIRRRLDETRETLNAMSARVRELKAQREVARLPARGDEIAAANAAVAASRAQLAEAQFQLRQRHVTARIAGAVEDTLRRQGEYVAANSAIVSILPPQNIKIRFFAPETALAGLRLNQLVGIGCDACPQNLTARISFISSEAEFTPPVIYSIGNREKLVFLVEAKPSSASEILRPGLPVDVRPQP